MRGLGLCCVLIEAGLDQLRPNGQTPVSQSPEKVPARRTIFRGNEDMDTVPVLCEGWAASIANLPNGRQQILSFILPGEFVSSALIFQPVLHYAVISITELCYRNFDRMELRKSLLAHPDMFEAIVSSVVNEKRQTDQLAIDLGQRTAQGRVARLILNLWNRLSTRGMVRGRSFDFPLRQTHIADAIGITPVHVSNVLGEFRRSGVIEIADRSLKIADLERLQRLAEQ
jgi:CRP/FNR family transcriptional regulator